MHILLADHHPIFRRGIKCMMKDHKKFQFKSKIDDGKNLISGILEHNPDLLILELDLPNSNGMSSLREIRSIFPELKVLVVSSHPEEIYAVSSVNAGANGYISKTRPVKEIREAFIKVSQGDTFLSEDIKKQIKYRQNGSILKFKKLSIRELEVLSLLSSGKRNKDIAQQLSINEKTVSTYKTRLLKKLNIDNIADLIHQSRLLHITN
jgi:DNA-binding NarL/FixJ family response regulator